MERHPLNPDAKSLEEAFFARQNAKLLEKLRQQAQVQEKRAALREAAPNADDALLDRFMELGLEPETVLALTIVPLVAVAWADGSIDARERQALLQAASERGVAPGSSAATLLESWLASSPDPQLLGAWKRYVKTLWVSFDEEERHAMQGRMIDMARGVAEAAGGFLGIGPKISAAERKVLEELEQALR